jgi:hypothetical protein
MAHNLPPKGGFFLSQMLIQGGAEVLFWIRVMSDHARFIKDSLHPEQPNQLLITVNLITVWERLGQKVKGFHKIEATMVDEILGAVLSFREYQRELLGATLRHDSVTALSPTFYNHMLNELEEFLKVLSENQTGKVVNSGSLGNHLVWILDAAGHAAIIGSNLDKVESLYREEAKAFESAFDKMYLKTVELAGYYRSDSETVKPVLYFFNRQICELMKDFIGFLTELKEGLAQHQILGNLNSLIPDHMVREENYYLQKVEEANN